MIEIIEKKIVFGINAGKLVKLVPIVRQSFRIHLPVFFPLFPAMFFACKVGKK